MKFSHKLGFLPVQKVKEIASIIIVIALWNFATGLFEHMIIIFCLTKKNYVIGEIEINE